VASLELGERGIRVNAIFPGYIGQIGQMMVHNPRRFFGGG
jgi:NAD(P)-dependent dehydrogenase (short-subunit alcohol dehydrogenase family)